MQEKGIHFAPCPCGNWGEASSNPDEVTCGACVPIAAKHKRGAALQAYEQAECEHRNASRAYAHAEDARANAATVLNESARKMTSARKAILDLLPVVQ